MDTARRENTAKIYRAVHHHIYLKKQRVYLKILIALNLSICGRFIGLALCASIINTTDNDNNNYKHITKMSDALGNAYICTLITFLASFISRPSPSSTPQYVLLCLEFLLAQAGIIIVLFIAAHR